MRTIKIGDRTLKQSEIYLDLSELSESEMKSIPEILKNQTIEYSTRKQIEKGSTTYYGRSYSVFIYSNNNWVAEREDFKHSLTKITYSDFLTLMGNPEISEEKRRAFEEGKWLCACFF